MSLYDWHRARALRKADEPFYALIMAAVLKADTFNMDRMRLMWPDVVAEVERRYNSRLELNGLSGALPEDAP